MYLSALLNSFITLPLEAEREITQLCLDSRRVSAGSLFLAIKGTQQDGRLYIDSAIEKGAAVVLVEAAQENEALIWKNNVPLVPIYQLQQKLGEIAARFYQQPAEQLSVFGVTGTNGKTSCTHFLAQILDRLHKKTGIIGTLGSGFYNQLGEAGLTTPDAVSLQALLADFVKQGADAVAMEVSSHSIDQGRINGIRFEVGLFTNLTQDHLDYHGTLANYAAVKKRFLAEAATKAVVINAEDEYGRAWMAEISQYKPVYAYSANGHIATSVPLVYADNIQLSLSGITADIHSPWGEATLHAALIGQFNLANLLATLTALCVYGIPFQEVIKQLAFIQPVSARMQTVGGKQGEPLVVVDYAHTPDALEKVLQALRHHTAGKLICVFGCGGDRDQGKRALMARVAETWADAVIVTNDNPRHEDPAKIAADIMAGFAHPEHISICLDRSKAIKNSIQLATENDCILIAGKGAERYQQIGDQKIPFNDVEEVEACLSVVHVNRQIGEG